MSLESIGVKGISNANKKTKMLKHQLPGNNTLAEKEQAKLGSRKNRYGVFDDQFGGENEFDQIVENRRNRQDASDRKSLTPDIAFSEDEQRRAK